MLEKEVRRSGFEVYSCRSSGIDADSNLKDYIETEHCINACGLDRKSLGISSDYLLEPRFSEKLCSNPCYEYCPNIVDLFFNLAAGEGNNIFYYFMKLLLRFSLFNIYELKYLEFRCVPS